MTIDDDLDQTEWIDKEIAEATASVNAQDAEPTTDIIPGLSALLDDIYEYLTSYVYFANEAQPRAIALWALHTHCCGQHQPFEVVPYLLVTAAEKQSGKTTCRRVLGRICARSFMGSDVSAATLGRVAGDRTIFMDEIDGLFKGSGRDDDGKASDIKTILNSGFDRDGNYLRQKGNAAKGFELEDIPTFGPKALFGIGSTVPEATADRCIPIRLERKPKDAEQKKARERALKADGLPLHARMATMAETLGRLPECEELLPPQLDDRQDDYYEPLFAIAAKASPLWLSHIYGASRFLSMADQIISRGEQLLTDIRTIFEQEFWPPRLSTIELIGKPATPGTGYAPREEATGLCDIDESPWADYLRGKPITPSKVAAMMKQYGVVARRESVGDGKTPNSYYLADLRTAWKTWLNPGTAEPTAGQAAPTTDEQMPMAAAGQAKL